jgi:hypothetical protein
LKGAVSENKQNSFISRKNKKINHFKTNEKIVLYNAAKVTISKTYENDPKIRILEKQRPGVKERRIFKTIIRKSAFRYIVSVKKIGVKRNALP